MTAAGIVQTVSIDVVDGVLEADVAGDPSRPAVTFLHPGLWDRRTWDGHFERYAARYLAVRYDARGYGASTRPVPGRPYSHVEDLVGVLDALEIDRAALIGCSMGGATAAEAAAAHPARVSALVLVAPGLNAELELTAEEEAEFAALEPRYDGAMARGDLQAARDVQLEVWAPLGMEDPAGRRIRDIAFDNLHELTMDESGRRDLEPPILDRLGDIAAPTLVLPADHDPLDSQRIARIYAERVPGARLVEIPDTDHVVNMRRPEAFDDVVLAFLEEVLA